MARAHLVDRLAINTWKLKRCTRIDRARIRARQLEAYDRFDQIRSAQIAAIANQLDDHPAEVVAELSKSIEGLTLLLGMWEGLQETIADPAQWADRDAHHGRFFRLQGIHPDEAGLADGVEISLLLILHNDPAQAVDEVEAKFAAEPIAAAEMAANAAALRHKIKAQILACEIKIKTLPPDPVLEGRRAEYAELEAHADDDEDEVLRRYEARLERSVRADLKQLTDLVKSGADLVEDDAPSEAADPEVESVQADPPTPEPAAAVESVEKAAVDARISTRAAADQAVTDYLMRAKAEREAAKARSGA
jgi:hypothetical protein